MESYMKVCGTDSLHRIEKWFIDMVLLLFLVLKKKNGPNYLYFQKPEF